MNISENNKLLLHKALISYGRGWYRYCNYEILGIAIKTLNGASMGELSIDAVEFGRAKTKAQWNDSKNWNADCWAQRNSFENYGTVSTDRWQTKSILSNKKITLRTARQNWIKRACAEYLTKQWRRTHWNHEKDQYQFIKYTFLSNSIDWRGKECRLW